MYRLAEGAPSELGGGQDIKFDEAAYELGPGGQGDFDSPVLRLSYSSLATPRSTIDFNMVTGKRWVRRRQHGASRLVAGSTRLIILL